MHPRRTDPRPGIHIGASRAGPPPDPVVSLPSGGLGSILLDPPARADNPTQGPRGRSSAGRALAWHARGRRFDPDRLHSTPPVFDGRSRCFLSAREGAAPSLPRSAVSSAREGAAPSLPRSAVSSAREGPRPASLARRSRALGRGPRPASLARRSRSPGRGYPLQPGPQARVHSQPRGANRHERERFRAS